MQEAVKLMEEAKKNGTQIQPRMYHTLILSVCF